MHRQTLVYFSMAAIANAEGSMLPVTPMVSQVVNADAHISLWHAAEYKRIETLVCEVGCIHNMVHSSPGL